MKGDFSRWDFDEDRNYSGVLLQQGRVLLDEDWNAQTRITSNWQDTMAQDTIGPGVAAVPGDTPHAFEVVGAKVEDGQVKVTLSSGRVWADGLLVNLGREQEFTADYLEPPLQSPPADLPPGSGIREAVILEVWREAVSGFQEPETLMEPALGGVDTTERVQTAMALRLLRLEPGEACENIRPRLDNDLENRGRLTVSLMPTTTRDEDCPVVEEGGYTGFEHHLYRVEIARVNSGTGMFKWSRFNGGLVGRGECLFDGDPRKIAIKANVQPIKTSGLESFYLEVIEQDNKRGHRRVTYGAEVVLNGDDLEVSTEHYSEPEKPSGIVFFRLWDGIARIADFPRAIAPSETNHLRDGILVEFDDEDRFHYRAGDYWTFPVRAGNLPSSDSLPLNQPPHGVQYHRVPLAELHWGEDPVLTEEHIEDCRRVFSPLTKPKICCSFTVGDGISTHGDYDSIQEALDKLPPWGGELCLLPGFHRASVSIAGMFNVTIKGCGLRTLVMPTIKGPPIFAVRHSWLVTLENMLLVTFGGTAVDVQASIQVRIGNNAIFAYRHAVRLTGGGHFCIHQNVIRMLDRPGGEVAIYIAADDGLIEGNNIGVIPAGAGPPPPAGREAVDWSDECIEPKKIEADTIFTGIFVQWGLTTDFRTLIPTAPFRALGGIQVGSGSERLKILHNRIIGGDGNGITLGSNLDLSAIEEEPDTESGVTEITVSEEPFYGEVLLDNQAQRGIALEFEREGRTVNVTSGSNGTTGGFQISLPPGTYRLALVTPWYRIDHIDPPDEFLIRRIHIVRVEVRIDLSILGFIYDVVIEGNEICRMGLSGIGTPQRNLAALLRLLTSQPRALERYPLIRTLAAQYGVVGGLVVDLTIRHNHIFQCMQNPFGIALQLLALIRGEGGISLGLCENLIIHGNRIEDNGQSHIEPLCGIFISFAAQADLAHNQIVNNGPLNPGAGVNLRPGIRGGVIIKQALPLMIYSAMEALGLMMADDSSTLHPQIAGAIEIAAATGGYAVRVHDNLVKQPVGQALTMLALGSVSVLDNRFHVDFSNYGNQTIQALKWIDEFAGGVLIIGSGAAITMKSRISLKQTAWLSWLRNFNGPTVFGYNQIRLGVNFFGSTAQIIHTGDDLSFNNNQSEIIYVPNTNDNYWANSVLFAETLRASYSRFREPEDRKVFILSLLTKSTMMNNTSNNQGDHCIIAYPFASANPHTVFSDNKSRLFSDIDCLKAGDLDRLENISNKINNISSANLITLINLLVLLQALLQHEAKRLEQKPVKDHKNLEKTIKRADNNLRIMGALEVGLEIADIKVPEVPENGVLVHGRVVDKTTHRGIPGLTILGQNKQKRPVTAFGTTETKASGYYALVLEAEALKRLQRTEVYLTVSTPARKIIRREKEPLELKPGSEIMVEIRLDRGSWL